MTQFFDYFGGKIKLSHPPHVPRPGEDALWLACSVEAAPSQRLLDIGSGSGAVALACAARLPDVTITALDNNPKIIPYLNENIKENGFSKHIETCCEDIFKTTLPPHSFDHICTNPPFHVKEQGFSSKNKAKEHAHGTSASLVTQWLEKSLNLLKEKGNLTLIHHHAQLTPILHWCQHKNLSVQQLNLLTHPDRPAKRVILSISRQKTESEQYLHAYDEKIRELVLKNGVSTWSLAQKSQDMG